MKHTVTPKASTGTTVQPSIEPEWVLAAKYHELTGVTPTAVHQRRKEGKWLDGTHCAVINRRLYVTLSDPAMEEALHDMPLFRDFVGLSWDSAVPDESTILRFRHLLETHKLAEQILKTVTDLLESKKLLLRTGRGERTSRSFKHCDAWNRVMQRLPREGYMKQLLLLGAALALVGCSSAPSEGDIEDFLESRFAPCKNIKVVDITKTNGYEQDGYYRVEFAYSLELKDAKALRAAKARWQEENDSAEKAFLEKWPG